MAAVGSTEFDCQSSSHLEILRGWTSHGQLFLTVYLQKQSNLWPFRLLLPELIQRLSDCSRTELIPLLAIENVKRARAHQLYAAGFKTVAAVSFQLFLLLPISQVAKADFTVLMSKMEHLRKFQAIKIINSARALLRDQLDEKLEEIEAIGIDLKDIPLL